jgi:dihydroorotate dehydrogenase (NAD+) catalytic subunit
VVDLSVEIGSLRLQNPVMPGSVTLAEGFAQAIDLNELGAIVIKTIAPDVRQGVPPPRVVEYRDATLFSIGIPSKGPDHLLDTTLPLYRDFKPPLIASVSADATEGFGHQAAYISVPGVAAIEAEGWLLVHWPKV